MRQLLLLRHAKSSWDDRDLADHERPLNPRGRQAATAMRAALESLGLVPDLVLVSSAVRTLQTLDALEPWPERPLVDHLDILYLAPVPVLLTTLRATAETVRSLMVIGHNPGLHKLALLLVGAHGMVPGDEHTRTLAEGYPSGALAEFAVPGPWRTLDAGAARLTRFICPRSLPGG